MDLRFDLRLVGTELWAFSCEENPPAFAELGVVLSGCPKRPEDEGRVMQFEEAFEQLASMMQKRSGPVAEAIAKRAGEAGIDEAICVTLSIAGCSVDYWLVTARAWHGLCPVWLGGDAGPVVIPRGVPEPFYLWAGEWLDGVRSQVFSWFGAPEGWMFWRARPVTPRFVVRPCE